jgi:hypothetical protein
MTFAFFRFKDLDTQARFNTDAIFLGAIAAFFILLVLIYALSKLFVVMNDVKAVLSIAMAYASGQDKLTADKITAGKDELKAKVEESRQELGHKIDEVRETVTNAAGGSGVNLGGPQ